jgi:polyisoprenoid-binding protein YceI
MRTHQTAPRIEQTTWRIDPDRSSVDFSVKALWGLATVEGRFTRYHGRLDLSATPAVELTIEADSLDTKNRRRDKHLRSPDFFGAEEHPYVRFTSERAELDGEHLKVRGHLHAGGACIPLDIEATLRAAGDHLELQAVTDADHRQLGMTWNLMGMIQAPTRLHVKGRLVHDG